MTNIFLNSEKVRDLQKFLSLMSIDEEKGLYVLLNDEELKKGQYTSEFQKGDVIFWKQGVASVIYHFELLDN